MPSCQERQLEVRIAYAGVFRGCGDELYVEKLIKDHPERSAQSVYQRLILKLCYFPKVFSRCEVVSSRLERMPLLVVFC